MIKLTETGQYYVNDFISEITAKRKEILDAGKDTVYETNLPNVDDIICDIECFTDEDGEYYNSWGITDNYNSHVLRLSKGIDFEEVDEYE